MNPRRIQFDLYIIILAIYNSIFLPFEIAFKPAFLGGSVMYQFNKFTDLSFLLDIILNFRTTYVNQIGEEEKLPYNIAINYLKFRFWIDIISTIPFEDLVAFLPETSANSSLKNQVVLISCLKLFRILRLGKLINYL